MMEGQAIIMAALSTLSPPQLSLLSYSLSSHFLRHHSRLSSLLSSPHRFSQSLRHLHSLSLPAKSLLIARHLLSALRLLTHFFCPSNAATPPPPSTAPILRLPDYDAVLLLLLLCEVRQHHPEALGSSPSEWRVVLCQYFSETMLSVSGVGVAVLIPYIDVVTRCRRFLAAMDLDGGSAKMGREVAASPAAVVKLPSVEVSGDVAECAICREEMREGRDVCELPCEHLFHWMCILPWVRKRNTCPCCRFRLPTDDVFTEIERLWEVLVKSSGGNIQGDRT